MNLPDSDSELSASEQLTLIKMIISKDVESTRLALSIINNSKKPGIAINYPFNLVEGKYPILMVQSFFQYVRYAAIKELLKQEDEWIKENRDMLKRLEKY